MYYCQLFFWGGGGGGSSGSPGPQDEVHGVSDLCFNVWQCEHNLCVYIIMTVGSQTPY